jgi:lysyl-tRNA synthetase class 2
MATSQAARLRAKQHRLEARARIIQLVRQFFIGRGFLEVETPLRTHTQAPEEHTDAVGSEGWLLATSPELPMKRLLAAGYKRIFQICKAFRARERGALHVPEFTLLEWYRAHENYRALMDDCEQLLVEVAAGLGIEGFVTYRGGRIGLAQPWPRITVEDAFRKWARWEPGAEPDPERFSRDMISLVEPALPGTSPVFLVDYPATMAALARLKAGDSSVAERFELYTGGLELANGFSELTDPAEQRARFEKANTDRAKQGRDAYPMPEKFLAALETMPPSAGIALGIDRLVMLFTDAATIDDVVAFTPEDL